jgi:hypothetical protein
MDQHERPNVDHEEERPHGAVETLNDPRVTAILRAFVVVLLGVTTTGILTGLSLMGQIVTSQSEIKWRLDNLTAKVNENDKQNERQQQDLNDMRIKIEVQNEMNRNHGWRLSRLERRAGIQ